MLALIFNYLRPRGGRMNRRHLRLLGEYLDPPAWFSIGPIMVLIDLPERLWAKDREPTLEEFNARVRQLQAQYPDAVIEIDGPAGY